MTHHHFNDAQHWRDRAAEARTVAAAMPDDIGKQTMLGIAASYDRLAARAERKEATLNPPGAQA